MKVFTLTTLLLLGTLTARAEEIQFNHADGTLTCGSNTGKGTCTLAAPEGAPLAITFLNSVPELLVRKVTITEQNAALRKKVLDIIKGGKVVTETTDVNKSIDRPLPARGDVSTLQKAYEEVEKQIGEVNADVSAAQMDRFAVDKSNLRLAVTGLAAAAGGFDAVADKLKTMQLQRPISEIPEWWRSVQALNRVSDAPVPLQPETTFVTDDLQITVEFTSTNPLIKAPQPLKATVVLSSGWLFGSSTGFAGSKLVDDHYTDRTITDKEAMGTTPAVTHREAVREQRDAAAAEATYFVHLRRVNPLFGKVPVALSFGVGLATGVKGRLYTGLSLPLGRAGALTFGVAGGTVKRLSRNIDPKNLGDKDPEVTRRDVFQTAPFIALSFRLE
jgi:hypothetical protein